MPGNVTGSDELLGLFPPGTSQDVDGTLVVGSCRLDDLAGRFGTPVLVVDEAAVRRRARDYRHALAARWPNSQVVFASKAFPCTAVGRVKRSWPQADGARRPRLAALAWAGGSSDLAS